MSKEVSVQELFASLPNVGDLVKFDVPTGDVRATVLEVKGNTVVVQSILGGVVDTLPANMVRPL